MRAAGLRLGDRVVAIDGRAQNGLSDLFVDLHRKKPGDTMVFSIERQGERLTLVPKIGAVAFGAGLIAIVFGSVVWFLIPWLCFAIGFWVIAVRIRDPRAWMLLGILLGIGEMAGAGVLDARGWGGVGVAVGFYQHISTPVWSVCMMLFGIYFPQRWQFDRRFPWVKWAIGGPLLALAAWEAITFAIGSIDYPAAAPLRLNIPSLDSFETALSYIAPCFFFIGLSNKYHDSALAPGDRRRLQLLYFGTTLGMTPLFLVGLYARIFHQPEDDIIALALLPLLIFPLTMAYVIVVHRAMDVRMVARLGLQYALARRGILYAADSGGFRGGVDRGQCGGVARLPAPPRNGDCGRRNRGASHTACERAPAPLAGSQVLSRSL